jgi:hypothetical protein
LKNYESKRYTILDLPDIDEVWVLIYLYVKWAIEIEADCISSLEENTDVFFKFHINKEIFTKYTNTYNIRISHDRFLIIDSNEKIIYTLTSSEQILVSLLLSQKNDWISLKNIAEELNSTEWWTRQVIKEFNKKMNDHWISHKIEIISPRGSKLYKINS